jgi:hypothetical protein
MMKTDRESSLREELLDEITENLRLLKGAELDAYLLELGLDPDDLLASFDVVFQDPEIAAKRRMFEAARRRSQASADAPSALILSFDPARKREIFATVKKRADATGDMTIAARNRRIESEDDLDSLLEAWLRLGVIDESGNLKE